MHPVNISKEGDRQQEEEMKKWLQALVLAKLNAKTRQMRFAKKEKDSKRDEKIECGNRLKWIIEPTCNNAYLMIQKAAQNKGKPFKTIKRVKGLIPLCEQHIEKICLVYQEFSEDYNANINDSVHLELLFVFFLFIKIKQSPINASCDL